MSPFVREVCNRSAVSAAVRKEYSFEIDYLHISETQPHCSVQLALATEEDDLVCLIPDLDLSLDIDRTLEGGSEFAVCIVGKFVRGSRLPPEVPAGLAEREMRGQPICPQINPKVCTASSEICCR